MSNIVVIPFSKNFERNVMFDVHSKSNFDQRLSPYIRLYNILTTKGYKIATFDRFSKDEFNSTDIYLSFNHHENVFNRIGKKINNRILIAQEPLSQVNFLKETLQKYSKILSWNDSIIDNILIERITAVPIVKIEVPKVAIEKKKLITNISINKNSKLNGELYSERIKAIELAEEIFDTDFELYGIGWNRPITGFEKLKLKKIKYFKSYKGNTADKFETLRHFKFSLCFENTRLMKGNISEKIFDCFQCGVIPLYWGAPDIKDFVPEETFIWRENFKSTEDMLLFVKCMTNNEIKSKLDCADEFLRSEKMNSFWEQTYVDKIVKAIESIANL
ncbi:MAG: glycosyltransferase family 10 [Bacteroidia bacterium]